MKKSVIIIIEILMFLLPFVNAQEKVVSIKGKPKSSRILEKEIGAVTYIAPPSKSKFFRGYFLLTGFGKPKCVVSGKNHTLEGKAIKGGAIPGVVFLENARIGVRKIRLEGNPPKESTDYLFIKKDVLEFLKKYADIVITENKVYNGGTIGSFQNPKIVVVDSARLVLKKDFKGYGVLILTGNSSKKRNMGSLRLLMEDNAKWYGIVVADVKKVYLKLYGKKINPSLVPGCLKASSFIKGDLDKDGDIDKDDLNILLSYRNQPADKCPQCDLDGDGEITVLDSRKLVLKCTNPHCAPGKKSFLSKKDIEEQMQRPQIIGALLLESKIATVKLSYADILYSKEAVQDLVCKKIIENEEKIKEVVPLEWEEYKEEER